MLLQSPWNGSKKGIAAEWMCVWCSECVRRQFGFLCRWSTTQDFRSDSYLAKNVPCSRQRVSSVVFLTEHFILDLCVTISQNLWSAINSFSPGYIKPDISLVVSLKEYFLILINKGSTTKVLIYVYTHDIHIPMHSETCRYKEIIYILSSFCYLREGENKEGEGKRPALLGAMVCHLRHYHWGVRI